MPNITAHSLGVVPTDFDFSNALKNGSGAGHYSHGVATGVSDEQVAWNYSPDGGGSSDGAAGIVAGYVIFKANDGDAANYYGGALTAVTDSSFTVTFSNDGTAVGDLGASVIYKICR